MLKRLVLLFAVVFAPLALAQTGPQPILPQSELVIEAASGRHRFTVELANTPETMSRGLMFRTQMAPDAGMLFDFRRDDTVAFWMRNTILPLDMLFIDRTGRIANIAERTVPFSEATVPSQVPVRAVLEVNAGTVQRLGIRVGDRVTHRIFRND